MDGNRTRLAWLLIVLGALLAAERLTVGAGWLWTTLAGAGFLVAYARQRIRGLLLLGCVLSGVGVGLLLGAVGVTGGFWVALGIGVMAIDRIEPEADKRALRAGAAVTAFGLLYGVASAGWIQDARFALVLITAGLLLLATHP
ncbi:MAG: hypothetical protein WD336_09965, partial [Trueperaceae bacterium]